MSIKDVIVPQSENPTFPIYIRQLLYALLISMMLAMVPVFALPVGGVVTGGAATISSPNPNTLLINQTSNNAIYNWQSFNIGAGELTHFQQPGASSMALNRIDPTEGPSQIYGSLTSNGRIILINGAGIYFGPTSYVNVAGLIATTSNISNSNFLAGKLIFDEPSVYPNASIVNAGQIVAAQHGLVALVGNNVRNDGLIEANLGNVVLASGNKFTINFGGDGSLINFAIDEKAAGSVTNSGIVKADGGKILMTARAASNVLDNVINMNGVLQANSVSEKNGEIILSANEGGSINVSGKISAAGTAKGTKGGKILIAGNKHIVLHHAVIDASGDVGGGNITVLSNISATQVPIERVVELGKVFPRNSYVYIDANSDLNASALTMGDGGSVILKSAGIMNYAGNIVANGGAEGGNGGSAEVSGTKLIFNGSVDMKAPNGAIGKLLLDPFDILIVSPADMLTWGLGGENENDQPPYLNVAGNAYSATNPVGGVTLDYLTLNGDNTDYEFFFTVLSPSALQNLLQSTDVSVGGADIYVLSALNWSSPQRLSLFANAVNNIDNLSIIVDTVDHNYFLSETFPFVRAGNIYLNAPITATAGALTLSAQGQITSTNSNTLTSEFNQFPGSPVCTQALFCSQPGYLHYVKTAVVDEAPVDPLGVTAAISVNELDIGNASSWIQVNPNLPTLNVTTLNVDQGSTFLRTTGGGGTASSPYLIKDMAGLQGINYGPTWANYFQLTNNIDASNLGSSIPLLTVHLNGNFHSITGLSLNDPLHNDVGLFSEIGSGGYIDNLNISGGSVTGGAINVQNIGAIAGKVDVGGTINHSSASTAVSGGHTVGGLVGENDGVVTNSSFSGSVTASGAPSYQIGSLVGSNTGTLSHSSSSGSITGTSASSLGGLVGGNSGAVSASGFSGSITLSGDTNSNIGGLIGLNSGTVDQSYTTGALSLHNSNTDVGGFVGSNEGTGAISSSYTTAPITMLSNNADVGGFVGLNAGSIQDSYSSNTLTVNPFQGNNSNLAGFVGYNNLTGDIQNSYTNSTLILTDSFNNTTGGFAALSSGLVVDSYWDSDSSGTSTSAAGIAGCLSGYCSAGSEANLSAQATYAGWDFVNTWNIVEDSSYPYLRLFNNPSSHQIISGSIPAVNSGDILAVYANGSLLQNIFTNPTGYHLILSPGSLAVGSGIVVYDTNPALNADAVGVIDSNGSAPNLSLIPNTLFFGGSAISPAELVSIYHQFNPTSSVLNKLHYAPTTSITTNALTVNPGISLASSNLVANGGSITDVNLTLGGNLNILGNSRLTLITDHINTGNYFVKGNNNPVLIIEPYSSNRDVSILTPITNSATVLEVDPTKFQSINVDVQPDHNAFVTVGDSTFTHGWGVLSRDNTPLNGISVTGNATGSGLSDSSLDLEAYVIDITGAIRNFNSLNLTADALVGPQHSVQSNFVTLSQLTQGHTLSLGSGSLPAQTWNIDPAIVDALSITYFVTNANIGNITFPYAVTFNAPNIAVDGSVTSNSSISMFYNNLILGNSIVTQGKSITLIGQDVTVGSGSVNTIALDTTAGGSFPLGATLTLGQFGVPDPLSIHAAVAGTSSLLLNAGSEHSVYLGPALVLGNLISSDTVNLGGASPLATLAITSGEGIILSGGNFHTTGSQSYHGPVSIGSDTTLNASQITVEGDITDTGSSNLTFNGPLTFSGSAITTAKNQTYANSLTLTSASNTTLMSNSGSINVGGDITAAHGLSLQSNSILINTNDLSLTTTAGDLTLNGAIAWNVPLIAPVNLSLVASSGNINLNGALDSRDALGVPAASLTLNAGGNITSSVDIHVKDFNLEGGQWLQLGTLPIFDVTNFNYSGGSFTRAANGDGSSGNPYQIVDVFGLQGIETTPTEHFILNKDLDLAVTSAWNAGRGFVPIGTANPFSGSFNGQGFAINNLFINRPSQTNVGLFGVNNGMIENLVITGSVTGKDAVGAVAGTNNGTMQNVLSQAVVTGVASSANTVGGLVGVNNGSITQSANTSSGVSDTGSLGANADVGGLVGLNTGSISTSYNTASVNTHAGRVGGLIGDNSGGSISDSYNAGPVSANTGYAGGVAGIIEGASTILNTYNSGLVSGAGAILGGLVGLDLGGTVTSSYWDSSINSGIAGGDGIAESTSSLLQQATYSGWDFVNTWFMLDGGTRPFFLNATYSTNITSALQLELISLHPEASYQLMNNIDISPLLSNLSGIWPLGFAPIPTLSGSLNGQGFTISNLYINQPMGSNMGLINTLTGSVHDLALVNATVTGGSNTGGLIGLASPNATLFNIIVSGGTVSGTGTVGGLVGTNQGSITTSYSGAAVTGVSGHAGGLVGDNAGTIDNTYSIGAVAGGSGIAGGLVGLNTGSIDHSYASGAITGSGAKGGLVGLDSGSTSNSFWDITTTGINDPNYPNGMGQSITTLLLPATYTNAGWDLTNTWLMVTSANGDTRPLLKMEYNTQIGNAHQLQLIGTDLAAHYDLIGNVDLSGTSNQSDIWANSSLVAGGFGFIPIGSVADPFTGVLDGHGYMISHFDMRLNNAPAGFGFNVSSVPNIGLLGVNNGLVENIKIAGTVAFTLESGLSHGYSLGGLVGLNTGTVSNAVSNMVITNNDNLTDSPFNRVIGGLVGTNTGTITNSYSDSMASITLDHDIADNKTAVVYVGGLVGLQSAGSISGSYNLAHLETNSKNAINTFVGGLVGSVAGGSVANSYNSGAIAFQQKDNNTSGVGGLVGYLNGTLSNSFSNGVVTIDNSNNMPTTIYNFGGLVGFVDTQGAITKSYSSAAINNVGLDNSSNVGGLVGSNNGSIADSYSLSPITVGFATNVGGLVGRNDANGQVSNSFYGLQSITVGNGSIGIGGLIGINNNSLGGVAHSYWDVDKSGISDTKHSPAFYGTGYSTSALLQENTYTGWDFVNTWGMHAGVSYPYLLAFNNPHDFQILTITALDESKVYGHTLNFAGTEFSSTGLLSGDSINSILLMSTGAPATANVGSYSIDPSDAVGTGLDKYIIRYLDGTLSVTPKALTITANNASKTYGQTFALNGSAFTSAGLVNNDAVNSVTLNSAGAQATALVGGSPYIIVPSAAMGNGLSNYTISYVNGALTINPAALTITAKNANKIYGQTITFAGTEFIPTGLVNSDTVNSVTLLSAGAPATASVSGSPYAITPSAAMGNGLSNYTISYVNGALTINPAALTITAKNANKIYGQTITFAGTEFIPTGLVNSDTVNSVTLLSAGAPATASVSGSPYAIAPSAAMGSGLSNYTISYLNGALTITPRPITVTANAAAKVYGTNDPVFTYVIGGLGLVNGDSLMGNLNRQLLTNNDENVGNHAILQGTLAASNNYNLTYTGANLNITPAQLSYLANPVTRPYDQNNPTFTGQVIGKVNATVDGITINDTITATSGTAVFTTPATITSDVGSYKIIGSGLSVMSGNYQPLITQAPSNATALTIIPAALSISVPSATSVKLQNNTGATALVLTIGNQTTTFPLSDITSLVLNGVGSDTINLNYSNGLFGKPVKFSSSVNTNLLNLSNATVNTITYDFSGAGAGDVLFSGNTNPVTYSGISNISDTLAVANRIFNFNGSGSTINLSNGVNISSGVSPGGTYSIPTSTLTINGKNNNIAITSNISSNYLLTLNNTGANDITVNSGLNIALGGVNFTAGRNLAVNSTIGTGNGNISLIGHGNLATQSQLSTTSGSVFLEDFGGPITIGAPIFTGSGGISLITQGTGANQNLQNLNIYINAAIKSTSGNILINAGDLIYQNASIKTGGTKKLEIEMDSD